MRKFHALICWLVVIYASATFAFAENVVEEAAEIAANDSMELCPPKIEVYPEKIQVGDVVYIKMTFDNNTDSTTWAFPKSVAYSKGMDRKIFSFYFKDDKSGLQLDWNSSYGTNEFAYVQDVWQPIKSGKSGRTQHWLVGIPFEVDLENGVYPENFYGFCFLPEGNIHGSDKDTPYWKEIRKNGAVGHLVVTICTEPEITLEAPINKTVTETCEQKIEISPRDLSEIKAIRDFSCDKKIFEYLRAYTPELKDEFDTRIQNIIDTITPGTLRNTFINQRYYVSLCYYVSQESCDENEITKILDDVEKWYASLNEIEREGLKNAVVDQDSYSWFLDRLKGNESLEKRCKLIFGNPGYMRDQNAFDDLSPWDGRNPQWQRKLHPSNTSDQLRRGGIN
ncbi:MAG: hypothetical protein ACRC2T_19315 [Thermoguttaceae bacterium]